MECATKQHKVQHRLPRRKAKSRRRSSNRRMLCVRGPFNELRSCRHSVSYIPDGPVFKEREHLWIGFVGTIHHTKCRSSCLPASAAVCTSGAIALSNGAVHIFQRMKTQDPHNSKRVTQVFFSHYDVL